MYRDLTLKLGELFMKGFEAVYQKEMNEKDFLPLSDFKSCKERAKKGIDIACQEAVDTLAYADAYHQETSHGADTMEEQTALLSADADPSIVDGVAGFWNE